MIKSSNTENTRSIFTNGDFEAIADAPSKINKGEECFSPAELLEASLASCVAITVRLFAQNHDIKLQKVTVEVKIDDSNHDDIKAYKKIVLEGDLEEKDRIKLLNAAKTCKIGKILSKGISFVEENELS